MAIATIFVFLFLILSSLFVFYYFKQTRTVIPVINEVNSTLSATTTSTVPSTYPSTPLLFPKIRWAKMPLSVYIIPSNCTSAEAQEVLDAESIWTQRTNGIISFVDSNSPDGADVAVDCLKDSSSFMEGRRIVRKVGEGGPSSVYDTGLFNLSTKGKIFLFTSTVGCDKPIIAIHEMGHVLGLDHSTNPNSVMYEYEDCNQDITPDIVSTLQYLYSFPDKPDLYFSDVAASQKNFYLSLNMTVKNEGLAESSPTTISILADGKEIKSIPVDSIKPSQGYFYTLNNIFVSNEVAELKITIDPGNTFDELSKSNNVVILTTK